MRRTVLGAVAFVLGGLASAGVRADEALSYTTRPVKKRGPDAEAGLTKASGEPTPASLLADAKALAAQAKKSVTCATSEDRAAEPAKTACSDAKGWIDCEIANNRAETLAGADSLQQALLEQRRRVSYLKKWVGEYERRCRDLDLDPRPEACGTLDMLRTQVNNVRTELSKGMAAEGLRETLTAELVTGALLGRTQAEPSGTTQANAPVYLQIKSRPFGFGYDQDRDLEFRLGVRFGLVPTLSLVEPAPQPSPTPAPTGAAAAAEEAEEAPAATDTLNTVFEVRADMARAIGDSSDLGITLAAGQIWSTTEQVQRKLDGQDTLFVTLPGEKGRDALFFEAGLRFRYFDDIPRGARAEQPSIEPRIELSAAYRHDPRLNVQSGTLAFDSPEDRLVARLMLSGIPVVNKKNAQGKPVHLGIGMEHERGFGTNAVPSVTRIFVRGDVDLLKALAGGK